MDLDINKLLSKKQEGKSVFERISDAISGANKVVEESGLSGQTKVRILNFWGFKLLLVVIVFEILATYLKGVF